MKVTTFFSKVLIWQGIMHNRWVSSVDLHDTRPHDIIEVEVPLLFPNCKQHPRRYQTRSFTSALCARNETKGILYVR